ncbi:MAG: CFI-box-CTERM domain-containing protein [Candidatus Aminicenantaceae bacterium]
MKRLILAALFFFFITSFMFLNAQWARTYGGSAYDHPYLLQQTNDGGCIIAGNTSSVGGKKNLLVLKLDSNGDVEWQKVYESVYYSYLISLQLTNDGGYVIGCQARSFDAHSHLVQDEFWILKLDQSGDIDWQESIGRIINGFANSIQQTSDGGYIVAGNMSLTEHLDPDFFVLKLSSAGDIEWEKTFWTYWEGIAKFIQQTSDEGYIITGRINSIQNMEDAFVLKLFPSGEINWSREYGGMSESYAYYTEHANSIQQTIDGGYILTGSIEFFGAGAEDVLVLKLSRTGEIEWQRAYGGEDKDTAYSILQTNDGGYLIGGNTCSFGTGEEDFLIIKLSPSGGIEWQRTFGTVFEDSACSIQESNNGGYIVTGSISSFSAGLYDFLVIKLFQDGNKNFPCRFVNVPYIQTSDSEEITSNGDFLSENTDIVHEFTLPDFFPQITETIGYELCSEKPLLAILSSGFGTTDPVPGTYIYDFGTEVSITAIPESGCRFSGWSGDVTGTDNPITITLDSDKCIAANFIRQFTLTITSGEGGTTDPEPGTFIYDSGTEVTITAIPGNEYKFDEWSGDITGIIINPMTIALNSDLTITANFVTISEEEEISFNDIFRHSCFIATAAYGSPSHPNVKILRDFRDKYLMPINLGRKFVNLYYKYSPFVANLIKKHKTLRIAVRFYLLPLVVLSYSMVHFGSVITILIFVFTFMLPILFIKFWQRKTNKIQ